MLRTKYIIKPYLQIKYMIVSLIVVCLTGISVYYAFWSSLIRSAGMEQLSAGELRALEHAYQVSFIWVVVILLIAISLESIFLFHKLLGPIFVFENTVNKLTKGDFTVSAHSRKRDELKDTTEKINNFIKNIGKNIQDDRDKINEIVLDIDQGNLTTAKEKLSDLTKWCKLN